jgi:hypothetical protein
VRRCGALTIHGLTERIALTGNGSGVVRRNERTAEKKGWLAGAARATERAKPLASTGAHTGCT